MLADNLVKRITCLISFLFIINAITFNVYSQPAKLRTINYSSAEEVKKDKEYQVWIRPSAQSNPQPTSSTIKISGEIVALGSDPASPKKEKLPPNMTISGTIQKVVALPGNKKEIIIDWDKNSFNNGSYASKFKLNINQSITKKTVISAFLQYKAAKNNSQNNSIGKSANSGGTPSSSTASSGTSLSGGLSDRIDDALSQAGLGSIAGGGGGLGGIGGYTPPPADSGGGNSGSNSSGGSNANNDSNGSNNAASTANQSLCEPSFDFDNNQVAINARVGNEACKTITTVPMEETRTGCNIRLDIGNELAIITEKKRYTYNGSSNDITACYDTDLKYTLQKDKGDCQNGFDADSLSMILFFKYYYVDNSNKNYVSGCLEQDQKIPVEANLFKKEVVDYNHNFDERTSYEMLQTYVMIDGTKYNIGDAASGKAYRQTFQRGECVHYEVNRDNLNDVVYEHKQWGFRSADNVYHPVTDCAPDLDISYPVSLSDSNCSIEVNTVSRQYTVYKKETYTSSTGELVTITPCFETNDIQSILPSDITKDYANCADKVDVNLMQVRPQYREVFQKNNQKHNLSSCKYDPNGVVWAIKKSTEACSPIVDYISKKVFFQSQLSYNKTEKVISVSDCIRDSAIMPADILEDREGCIDQLSGDKKHYVHITNKFFYVSGGDKIYLQSCTKKLTNHTTLIPSKDILKDYHSCTPGIDFRIDDDGIQMTESFSELNGQALIAYYRPYVVLGYENKYLGGCVKDNSTTPFVAILEKNKCRETPDYSMSNNKDPVYEEDVIIGIVKMSYDISYINDKGEKILLYPCVLTSDNYPIYQEFSSCTPVSIGEGVYMRSRKLYYSDSIGNRLYLTDCEQTNDPKVTKEVFCEDYRFDIDISSGLVYYRTKEIYIEPNGNEKLLSDCKRSYNKAIVAITPKTCGYLHDDVEKWSQVYLLNSFSYQGIAKSYTGEDQANKIYPADATGMFIINDNRQVLAVDESNFIEGQQLGNLNSVKETTALGIDAEDPVSVFMDEYCVADTQAVFKYVEFDNILKDYKYNSVKYLYPEAPGYDSVFNNQKFLNADKNRISYVNPSEEDLLNLKSLDDIYKDFYKASSDYKDLVGFDRIRTLRHLVWWEGGDHGEPFEIFGAMFPMGVKYDASCHERSIFRRFNNYGGKIIKDNVFNYKINVYAHKPSNVDNAMISRNKKYFPHKATYVALVPFDIQRVRTVPGWIDKYKKFSEIFDNRDGADELVESVDFGTNWGRYYLFGFGGDEYSTLEELYTKYKYETPKNCLELELSLTAFASVWHIARDNFVKYSYNGTSHNLSLVHSVRSSMQTFDGEYTKNDKNDKTVFPIWRVVDEDIVVDSQLITNSP